MIEDQARDDVLGALLEMGVALAFDRTDCLGDRCRVVDELLAGRVEPAHRVVPCARQLEARCGLQKPERIDGVHLAELCAVRASPSSKFTFRVNDDDRAVGIKDEFGREEPPALSRPCRTNGHDVLRPIELDAIGRAARFPHRDRIEDDVIKLEAAIPGYERSAKINLGHLTKMLAMGDVRRRLRPAKGCG